MAPLRQRACGHRPAGCSAPAAARQAQPGQAGADQRHGRRLRHPRRRHGRGGVGVGHEGRPGRLRVDLRHDVARAGDAGGADAADAQGQVARAGEQRQVRGRGQRLRRRRRAARHSCEGRAGGACEVDDVVEGRHGLRPRVARDDDCDLRRVRARQGDGGLGGARDRGGAGVQALEPDRGRHAACEVDGDRGQGAQRRVEPRDRQGGGEVGRGQARGQRAAAGRRRAV